MRGKATRRTDLPTPRIRETPDVNVEFRVGRKEERLLRKRKDEGECEDQRRVSNSSFPSRAARTHFEREEQREPAQHLWADEMHSIWVNRKSDVSVEMSLEVSAEGKGRGGRTKVSFGSRTSRRTEREVGNEDVRESVQSSSVRDVEGQAERGHRETKPTQLLVEKEGRKINEGGKDSLSRPRVMRVRQRQASVIQNQISPRMLESPTLLDLRSTPHALQVGLSRQGVDRLEHDDVGSFCLLGISSGGGDLVEEFGGSERSEVGGVVGGDGDSVGWRREGTKEVEVSSNKREDEGREGR